MTTGERIRQARKSAGMTQAELAHKLGISAAGIAQWENDLRNPKIETLRKLADALGVTVTQTRCSVLFLMQRIQPKH